MILKVEIDIASQTLSVIDNGEVIKHYNVSTAKNGAGQVVDSECTPTGLHNIRAKIGKDMPVNTVFTGRRPTGEVYDDTLKQTFPERDWILTRILWLSGLEKGHNRLGEVDTMRRYIYIHGAPDSDIMGLPGSHGCIKMRNKDIIELFELLPIHTEVNIK